METVTFYITKYWLARGIIKVACTVFHQSNSYYACSTDEKGDFWPIGTEAFPTETEARQRVAELQKKKIASLTKQIEKLEQIDPMNMSIKEE